MAPKSAAAAKSLAARLKYEEQEREKEKQKAIEMAKKRAADRAAFNEKLRLEEEKRRQDALDAEERAIRKAEEDRVAEIKRKTKPHFQLNRFGRKEATDDDTNYYGEWMGAGGHTESKVVQMFGDAWVPHGLGEHRVKGKVFIRSYFDKGIPHGNAKIHYGNDEVWDVTLKNGDIQGPAKVTKPAVRPELKDDEEFELLTYDEMQKKLAIEEQQKSSKLHHEPAPTVKNQPPGAKVWIQDGSSNTDEDVIMKNNCIVCKKTDLVQGRQVQIFDFGNEGSKVSIMRHIRGWRYMCRFESELAPREKGVDFSTLKNFKVLLHAPLVYHTGTFGVLNDAPRLYDYWKDTYGKSYKEIKNSRITKTLSKVSPWDIKPLQFKERHHSKHDENVYEAEAAGYTINLKGEMDAKRSEEDKNRFNELIAKKRAQAEEERQKMIAEEEARASKEEQDKLREQQRRQKEEDAAYEKKMAKELKKQMKTVLSEHPPSPND